MSNTSLLPSKWVVWTLVVASTAAVAGLLAWTLTADAPGPMAGPCPPALEQVRNANAVAPEQVVHIIVLIDPATNEPAEAQLISRRLQPLILPHLEQGVTLNLLVDPGAGAPTVTSACFDGTSVFAVRNPNETRQRRALAAVSAETARVIEMAVVTTQVRPEGGPIGLLRYAPRPEDIDHRGETVVALWSDLLANDEGCLDPQGEQAIVEVAEAVVDRCVAIGMVKAVGGRVILLGAGESARSAGFEYWTVYVADELCAALSGRGDCQP